MGKTEVTSTEVRFSDTAVNGWVISYVDSGGKNPTDDVININGVEFSNKELDTLVELLLEVQMDIGLKRDSR